MKSTKFPRNTKKIHYNSKEEYLGDIEEDIAYEFLKKVLGFNKYFEPLSDEDGNIWGFQKYPDKNSRLDFCIPELFTEFEVKSDLKSKYWFQYPRKIFHKGKFEYFLKNTQSQTLVIIFMTKDRLGMIILRRGIDFEDNGTPKGFIEGYGRKEDNYFIPQEMFHTWDIKSFRKEYYKIYQVSL